MGSDDFGWVAQAIAIHREVGGNLAEVLDAVGATIRERGADPPPGQRAGRRGQDAPLIVLALPFVMPASCLSPSPGYVARFTQSGLGWRCWSVPGCCCSVGALWLKKMVSIRF